MAYKTLIDAATLAEHLGDPDWVVADCRFSLEDTELGRRNYQKAHIPGSVYAHLDEDLSSPVIPGVTGRHPLPKIEGITETFSSWGIDEQVQVAAYDDGPGNIAARLWWLLRWLGHEGVAVLDGGWSAWERQRLPTQTSQETRPARSFHPRPRPELVVETREVLEKLNDKEHRLLDARAPERYRGEVEPLDPVAGHIPGALNLPHAGNVDERGHFLSSKQLRARFLPALGDLPAGKAIAYCGSGVTAAHNLLAMLHAGLGEGVLYAGSWSEWITDPDRPIEKSS